MNYDDLPKLTSYTLGFFSPQGYNHDHDFLALGADGSTSILQAQAFYKKVLWWQVAVPHVRYYDNVPNDGFMGNLNVTLCEACKFMKFGTWNSDVTYANNSIDKMGGWWIGTDLANPVVSKNDMPNDGTAVFKGKAFGTLTTLQSNGDWEPKLESGKMRMDWNFAQRSGGLQISKFGGKNFSGEMNAPGFAPQNFGGTIGGSGASGLAAGSFVGQNGPAPRGVIGNFGLAADNWKANGVFGGGRTNFTPGGPGNSAVGN